MSASGLAVKPSISIPRLWCGDSMQGGDDGVKAVHSLAILAPRSLTLHLCRMAALHRVRVAAESDTAELRKLIERSARVLSRGYYTGVETESAIRYVFGVDSTLVADGTYFVAEEGDTLLGCGGWSKRRTLYGGDQRPVGAPELLDPTREPARIRAFFVAPEAARRGVGRSLLDECVKAATGAGFKSLELMSTLPGVPFYSALGFESVEQITDTLPDGVALRFVRMRRSLGRSTAPSP